MGLKQREGRKKGGKKRGKEKEKGATQEDVRG